MRQNNSRIRRPFKKEEPNFVGRFIRAQEVRCIDPDGNLQIMKVKDAIFLAETLGLDLVQISKSNEEIPTCKILDYSKFKYEQSKKDKLANKKQRENTIKIKEIKFRPSTGENDLKTKAKHAQEFLNEGHKLKITIVFKGREMAYKEVANETLDTFFRFLNNVIYETRPVISGKFMSAIIKKSEIESKIESI